MPGSRSGWPRTAPRPRPATAARRPGGRPAPVAPPAAAGAERHSAATAGGRPEDPSAFPAKAALRILTAVVAPATVLSALMYYFGWTYTATFTTQLGISPTVLDYSTQDYVLRSIDALFGPMVMLCGIVLAVLWLHARIAAHTATPAHPELVGRLSLALATTGALLASGFGVAVFRPQGVELGGFRLVYPPWAPRWSLALGIVLGLGLADYALQLRRRLTSGARAHGVGGQSPGWVRASQRAAVGGLMLLGLFWGATAWAQDVGQLRAATLRHDPATWQELPEVALYSPDDLLLDAPGVTIGHCSDDAAFGYRYTGLRLFTYANERYVLLPADWPATGGPAMVLSDTPDLRVELLPGHTRPTASQACPRAPAEA